MEISIGDYVLTGGEIPAIVLIDTISRLIPNVLGHENSAAEESLVNGLLEYPHYTRPHKFRRRKYRKFYYREIMPILKNGKWSSL